MGYSLAPSPRMDENGEGKMLSMMRGRINRFVDVGANVGDWTARVLSGVAPQASALLFEPNPEAVKRLRVRFARSDGVQIVGCALSRAPGQANLFVVPDCGETTSLVNGWHSQERCVTEVEVGTLDGILKREKWVDVDYVKVDTEGHDFDVLLGAEDLLSRGAVGVIQFEYGYAWALNGSTLGRAIRYLEKFGYETRAVTRNGPIIYDYFEFREFFRYSNFAAARPEVWSGLGC